MKKKAVTITKEITWDMAHRLSFHKGKCRNIHGHTYKLQVTVKYNDEEFIDFADLSKVMKDIAAHFDHKIFLDGRNADNMKLARVFRECDLNFVLLDYEPTAENMLEHIIENLKQEGWNVCSAKLWETPTSFAEVIL